jgi:DNA-binding NtrC family response regulator
MATFRLPASGDVSLGSSPQAQIRIEDTSVAPLHAILRMGPTMSLVDLGSGCRTSVGTQRLSHGGSHALSPSVVITVGAVTAVVQRSTANVRLRHVRSHEYFEGRLEDECARAEGTGGTFATLRIGCATARAHLLEEVFADTLQATDVVAMYAPGDYEILIVDGGSEAADTLMKLVRDRLAPSGLAVQVGLACYPRDARTPEALVAAAAPAIDGAPAGRDSIPPPMPSVMDRLRPIVERVAGSEIAVLILGETGVGKEVIAHAIHKMSARAGRPLVCLNCAAVSETLLESELFGYERGAFTGASQAKAGLLETAHGGTILLDEIGELPSTLQAKLLRVLEHNVVHRVGGLTPRPINARFLAATNRDLEEEIERGKFRRDLYFRLNGISLVIPPLRERVSEIEPLAREFIERSCRRAERARVPRLSREAVAILKAYAWPGNIRELRNAIERAVLLCDEDRIEPRHLPTDRMGRTLPPRTHGDVASAPALRAVPLAPTRQTGQTGKKVDVREEVVLALERCAGNQTQAAKLLGVSRRTLISRIEQHQLPRPRGRGD